MKRVRANSGRRVVVAAVDATAAADTAADVTVASEEAATNQPTLPSDTAVGSAVSADSGLLPIDFCAEDSAHYNPPEEFGQGWIRTSEGVKPADLQSAPFGHFGTYPSSARDFIYPRAPQLATRVSFPAAIDSANRKRYFLKWRFYAAFFGSGCS